MLASFQEVLEEIEISTIATQSVHSAMMDNLYMVYIPAEAKVSLSHNQIVGFLEQVVAAFKARLVQQNITTSMLFYSWYDEQAGQLRWSLIPGDAGTPLPFGSKTQRRETPHQIVEQFLQDPYSGVIPWTEFTQMDKDDPAAALPDERDFTLDGWVQPLGTG